VKEHKKKEDGCGTREKKERLRDPGGRKKKKRKKRRCVVTARGEGGTGKPKKGTGFLLWGARTAGSTVEKGKKRRETQLSYSPRPRLS